MPRSDRYRRCIVVEGNANTTSNNDERDDLHLRLLPRRYRPMSTNPSPPSPSISDSESIEEEEGLPTSVHRNEDGNALAISIVLSPDQIDALDVPESADTVRPVVKDGVLHLEPAEG